MAVQSSLKLAASGQLRIWIPLIWGAVWVVQTWAWEYLRSRVPLGIRGCGYGSNHPRVKISIEQGCFKITYPRNLTSLGQFQWLVFIFSVSSVLDLMPSTSFSEPKPLPCMK